jgi:uncharacterized membrane protein
MQISPYHYLPLSPIFFSILVGIFFIVVILLMLNALRYAYLSLGVSSGTATVLLFCSLIGSFFNIPIARLPNEQVLSNQVVNYFVVPIAVDWPGTVIAVNVGVALIPTFVSIYLLIKRRLWVKGAIATTAVAVVLHMLANPVRGVGIAVPVFFPVLTTAAVALLLAGRGAAPLAYIAGSMGTLIGADLTNFDKVHGLGGPIASIGELGRSTAFFLPASSRCCWRAFIIRSALRKNLKSNRSQRNQSLVSAPRAGDFNTSLRIASTSVDKLAKRDVGAQ